MSKPIVYLAGLISTEVLESLQWRHDVTPRLENGGFEVLSPMRGKDAFTLVSGGLTDPALTTKDIILRDSIDVKRADVILAHLEVFGGSRALLGTIAELAWAWELRTPVVGVALHNNHLMRNHPFVKEFISHYHESVCDAADFIVNYYGRK
jgi:nucleoside 2-deoxyribosyltransferase